MPKAVTDVHAVWQLGDPVPDHWVPADELHVAPDNPKIGDVSAIAHSIRVTGFFGFIYAQAETDLIIVGAHRYKGGLANGMTHFPVIRWDVDDTTRRRWMLADNRYAELGHWNDPVLAGVLDSFVVEDVTLDGTGFDDDFLASLKLSMAGVPEMPDDPAGGGGVVPPGHVRIQIGPITFSVDRDEWEPFEAGLVEECGTSTSALVQEVRERLGL